MRKLKMEEPKNTVKICEMCDRRIYVWQKKLNRKTKSGRPFIVHKRCWELN